MQDFNKKFIPRKHNVYRRNTAKYDKTTFYSDCNDIDWDSIINVHMEDTNESFNLFFDNFNKLLDKHIPLKKMSNKNFKLQFKPWITSGISGPYLPAALEIRRKIRRQKIADVNKFSLGNPRQIIADARPFYVGKIAFFTKQ